MKKVLLSRFVLVCSLSLLISTVRAQYVSIPDSNFGNWLSTHGYDTCLTGNSISGWRLDTTCPAILHASLINCAGDSISDITGIRYFKTLGSLFCERNKLTTLPALPSTLYYINCSFNALTSITALPSALVQISCSNNQLTTLPAIPASMRNISADHNLMTSLPTLPVALQYLICSNNQLSTLPALSDSLLYFDCSSNQLTSLPALPHVLRNLQCYANQLSVMPTLPDSLRFFNTANNQLNTLPALPSYLINLDCSYNQLTAVPATPTLLQSLYCQNNQLTALPALTDTLIDLNCSHNRLTALPTLPHNLLDINCSSNAYLTCLPIIYQTQLNNFYIDTTLISCIPDRFTAQFFDRNPDSLPVCDSTSSCPYLVVINTGIALVNNQTINSLYPNPNSGTFTLQTSSAIQGDYTITDMLGHVIVQQSIATDKQQIDMHDAPDGVYTLTVKGTQPLRFVIVR